MIPTIQKRVRGRVRAIRMVLVGLTLLLACGCVSASPLSVSIKSFESVNKPQVKTYQDPDVNLSQFREYALATEK